MIPQLAQFVNDCYHVWRAPAGSKITILRHLLLPSSRKMGFQIEHFDRPTLHHLYREIFARQYYYFRSESNVPVILDCGANLGMASLYFKWLYPNSRVQAFEPDPTTFQVLKRNVTGNNLDVETHNCALWDEDGEVDFFINSSIPGTLLMSTDASRCRGAPIKVAARRLSNFVQGTVDFLKLDVEGAEHRVLRDLTQTGKIRAIRQIVVEYHHRVGQQKSCLGEFLLMLERAGFEYQICSSVYPVTSKDVCQDVLIGAYQRTDRVTLSPLVGSENVVAYHDSRHKDHTVHVDK